MLSCHTEQAGVLLKFSLTIFAEFVGDDVEIIPFDNFIGDSLSDEKCGQSRMFIGEDFYDFIVLFVFPEMEQISDFPIVSDWFDVKEGVFVLFSNERTDSAQCLGVKRFKFSVEWDELIAVSLVVHLFIVLN